ncbi:MAG TPA: hypothetical protein VFN55_08540 [Solirubrobacteraceae bacterium]|nr:hypothetical protein [Solirubrobacteraceae bacterium]
MSTIAYTRRIPRRRGEPCSAPGLLDGLGDEPTLDEQLSGVWEGLVAHRPADCPLCGAEMRPAYGAHARPIGGRCTGCGTTLA